MIRIEGVAGLNRQGDKIRMSESFSVQQIAIFAFIRLRFSGLRGNLSRKSECTTSGGVSVEKWGRCFYQKE